MKVAIFSIAISVMTAVPAMAQERTALPEIIVGAPPPSLCSRGLPKDPALVPRMQVAARTKVAPVARPAATTLWLASTKSSRARSIV